MSYIAVDTFGDEYIYQFKPKRVIRTNTFSIIILKSLWMRK